MSGAPVGAERIRADSAGVLPCHIVGESGTLGRQNLSEYDDYIVLKINYDFF